MRFYKRLILTLLLPVYTASAEIIVPEEVFVSESTLGKFTCALVENKWIPGKLKKDGKTFNSFLADLEKLKLKLKLTSDSSKKALIQLKINTLKATNKSGKAACKKGPVAAGTPTPPAKGTATPGNGTPPPFTSPTKTPTPIPTLTLTNFDSFGNVTEKGKTTFAIPSNLSANIEKGKIVHTNNACAGCHGEYTTKSFTSLTRSVPYSPMYINLSQQEYADLTAYLNRFRP